MSGSVTGLARRVALVVTLPALLFAAWWTLSASSTNIYAPPLSQIVEQFRLVWIEGDRFVADVLPSLARLATGYSIAVVAGVVLGVVLGSSRTARCWSSSAPSPRRSSSRCSSCWPASARRRRCW